MQTFLSKIAEKAIREFPKSLDDLTIILPSRRAIVFLRDEFKKQLQSNSWLPQLISIEDFVQQLGKYQQIDQLDLIFEFYEVYSKIEGKNVEAFSEFISWAPTLIQDFNELDRHLVDAIEMYGFITEAKAIEIWNVDGAELTPFQTKYLNFWKKLPHYYLEYKKSILAKNKVYQGLGFRIVAESVEQLELDSFEKIYFAGFNALTAAEETIIDYCRKKKSAELIWDADLYYLDDHLQEAGYFLRQHQKHSKQEFNWISKELLEGEKEINIFEVSGNIAQAKWVGNILSKESNNNTAIVLSDENLLQPILESLPSSIKDINVTMGYPIVLSTIFNLIEEYFLLFKRFSEWKKIDKEYHSSNTFFYKDLIDFFENTSFKLISIEKQTVIKALVDDLKKQKELHINPLDLKDIEECLNIRLFNLSGNFVDAIVDNCIDLVELIRFEGSKSISVVEEECLYSFYKVLNRLKSMFANLVNQLDIETLYQLLRQVVSKQNVDFVGEPLSGLQIMGVLESRALDFEEVIITSVNEGVLPSGKTQNSFIPFDIKRKYGLPVYKEKDAIFSYHFYKLIQRAKKVSIIYNSKVNQLQGGEVSRFVKQILYEASTKNEKIKVRHHTIHPKVRNTESHKLVIPYNQKVKESIEEHIASGLSSSAINTYLNCPLNYYYKYVLKLKEEETIEDKIENRTLGTIIHDSLEKLYQPYLNQILKEEDIHSIITLADSELESQFIKELNIKPRYGNYKLNFEIAKVFLKNLLNLDLKTIKQGNKLEILKVEEEFQSVFDIHLKGKSMKLCLKGKIDRVDRLNGQLRIIDYKSGGVKESDLSYSHIESLLTGRKDKAIQILIYKMCYLSMLNTKEEVEAGIISLKNISKGFIPLKVDDVISHSQEFFTLLLDKMLSEQDFTHNMNSNFCKFC